jgi:hypothetical protein
MTRDERDEEEDALLRALRALPTTDAPDQKREARAAFVAAFRADPWLVRAARPLSRLAVPVALAGIVVVYLGWAVDAATALVQ